MTETCFSHMTWFEWIGQRVCVKGMSYGTLRYFGEITCNNGLWCGIELDEPLGETNGISNNVRYFTCKDNYGIFVPSYEVTKLNRDETNTDLCFTNNKTRESNVNYFTSNSAVCKLEDFFMKPYEIIEEFKNNDSNHNSNVDLNKTFDICNRLECKQLSDIAETSLEELNKCAPNCTNENKEILSKRKSEQEKIDRLDSEESLGIISDLLTDDMTFDLCKAPLDTSDQNLNNKIVHNLEDYSLSVFSPPNNISKMNLFLENIAAPLPYFENEHRCSSTPKASVNSQCYVKETKPIEPDLLHFLQDGNDVEPIIAGSNQTKFEIDFDVDEFKNSRPLTSTSKAFSPTQLISCHLLNEKFNTNSEGENSMLQEVFEMKKESRILNTTQTLSGGVKTFNCNGSTSSIHNCPDLLNCTFNVKSPASLELPESLASDSTLPFVKSVSSSIDKFEKSRALNSTFVLSGDKIKCISNCERTFIINHNPTKVADVNCSFNLGEDIQNITFGEKSYSNNKTYDKIDLLQCDNHVIEGAISMHPQHLLNITSKNSDKESKIHCEKDLSYCDEDYVDKLKSVMENARVENKSPTNKFSDETKEQQYVSGVQFSENVRNEIKEQYNSGESKTQTITNGTFSEHYNDEAQTLLNAFSNDLKIQKSTASSIVIENAMIETKVYNDDISKKLEAQNAITNDAFSKKNDADILSHSVKDFSDVKTQQALTEASFIVQESDIKTNEKAKLILSTYASSDAEAGCLKSQAQIKNIFPGNTKIGVETNKINSNPIGIVSVEDTSLKCSETVTNTSSEKTQSKTQYQHDSNSSDEHCDETKFMKLQKANVFLSEKDSKVKSFSKTRSFQLENDVRNKSLAKPAKIVGHKRGTREISRLPVNRSNTCKTKIENKVKTSELNSTFSSSGHQKQSSISSDSKRLSLPLVSSVKVQNIPKRTTDFKNPLLLSSKINVNKRAPECKAIVNSKKSNVSARNIQGVSKSFSQSVHSANAKNTGKVTKNAGATTKVLKSAEPNTLKLLHKTTLKANDSELKSDQKNVYSIQTCDEILDACKVANKPEKNEVLSQIEIRETNSEKMNRDYSVVSNLPIKTFSKNACNNNMNCISKPVIKDKDMPISKVCQHGLFQDVVKEKIIKNKPRCSLLPNVKLFAKNTSPEENGNAGTYNKMPYFERRKSVIPKSLSNESDEPPNKVTPYLKSQIHTHIEKQKENIRTSSQNSRLPLSSKSSKNTNLADVKNNFNRRVSLLPASEKPKGLPSSIARPNEAQNVPNSKNSQMQDSQKIIRRLPQLQKLQGTRSSCKKS